MTKRIAVILGAGAEAGLGGAMSRKAAAEGCKVIIGARSTDRIDGLAETIRGAGGDAVAHAVDVTDAGSVADFFGYVDGLDGQLDLMVYNVGNASGGDSLTMDHEVFEQAWRTCCQGGFFCAQEAGRRLVEKGAGSMLFTGATASVKARPPFLAFASAKAALRAMAACLARDLGPKGVHVAHIVIDGAIDGEKMAQRMPEAKSKLGENGMLKPDAIADAYWQLHCQHPSAWSFEIDLRPFKETF